MKDIVPELLDRIMSDFRRLCDNDEKIQRFLSDNEKGTAVSADAAVYAIYVGQMAAKALHDNLTADVLPGGKMYFNIADRIVRALAKEIHETVNTEGAKALENDNRRNGIGLKAYKAPFPEERVKNMIDKLLE